MRRYGYPLFLYILCACIGGATSATAGKYGCTALKQHSRKISRYDLRLKRSSRKDLLCFAERLQRKEKKLRKREQKLQEKEEAILSASTKASDAFQIENVFSETYPGQILESSMVKSDKDPEDSWKIGCEVSGSKSSVSEPLSLTEEEKKCEAELVSFIKKNGFVCQYCGKNLKGSGFFNYLNHVELPCMMCGEKVIGCLEKKQPHKCSSKKKMCFRCYQPFTVGKEREHDKICSHLCDYCQEPLSYDSNWIESHFLKLGKDQQPKCKGYASHYKKELSSGELTLDSVIKDASTMLLEYRLYWYWCPHCQEASRALLDHYLNQKHCEKCRRFVYRCELDRFHGKCGQRLQCQECGELVLYKDAEEHFKKHPKAWAGQTSKEAKENPNFLQQVCSMCFRVIDFGNELCDSCKNLLKEKKERYKDENITKEYCRKCGTPCGAIHLEGCESSFQCKKCELWFKPKSLKGEHDDHCFME